ncbi:MAG: undecaprenyl-diphosphate phosphatase [Anaerolineaceae bacterium]|nr:undecaprenyl-diphosphate phosphatase [Anaerolineaceae bacterium]MCY3905755.1 undecaprenyl-diphosphate phosphatase [Anaerolineaceae bacterium]
MSIDASDVLAAILLGVLEGLSEFLPISSTGHLIVGASLLDLSPALRGSFEISIQAGAVLALLLHYGRDLAASLGAIRNDARARHFWAGILVASLPAGMTGFLLRDWIKHVLFSPTVVAMALLAGGVVLLVTDREPRPAARDAEWHLSLRQALFIGCVQTLALVPGVSRSAATIVGAMRVGLDRSSATRFSFWLALPLLGGATLFELLEFAGRANPAALGVLLLGCAVSAVVAWLAIAWLLRFVSRHGLALFGWYRIGLGLLLLLLTRPGVLPSVPVA